MPQMSVVFEVLGSVVFLRMLSVAFEAQSDFDLIHVQLRQSQLDLYSCTGTWSGHHRL
jgi:hypothetical protein